MSSDLSWVRNGTEEKPGLQGNTETFPQQNNLPKRHRDQPTVHRAAPDGCCREPDLTPATAQPLLPGPTQTQTHTGRREGQDTRAGGSVPAVALQVEAHRRSVLYGKAVDFGKIQPGVIGKSDPVQPPLG